LRVEPIQGAREQSLCVDLSLLSAEGHLVAVLEGLHLKRASREQLQGHSSEPHADWLYAVEWLAQNPEDPHAGPDYWPDAGEIGGTILPSLARDLALPPEAARYGAFFEDIEDAAVDYIVAAFRRLGWEFPSGQRISTDALAARFGVIDRQRRLFERLLGILGDVGMLVRRSDSEWEVASLANHGDGADGGARLFREYPEAAAELTLLQRCGERLADVLRGECDPLGLLFPEGEPVTAANLYGDSPGARAANGTVRRLVRSLLERLPEDRRVRILEIGAGTGGTTSHLLDELPAERTDYVFTDISPLFVHRAAEKFSAYPFLRFSVLDIEEPPVGHGFEPGGYDLVVAANVLHATRDLRRSLHHVRELLAPGGLLVLLEGTAPLRFIDLIFGLTEGWWHFADPDLRPAHPLLSAERW
ncbi:MAG: methyltransferase, partial [Gammaproteobacteria bacterium]